GRGASCRPTPVDLPGVGTVYARFRSGSSRLWGRSSVGRALESHSRGRGVDSLRLHSFFRVLGTLTTPPRAVVSLPRRAARCRPSKLIVVALGLGSGPVAGLSASKCLHKDSARSLRGPQLEACKGLPEGMRGWASTVFWAFGTAIVHGEELVNT